MDGPLSTSAKERLTAGQIVLGKYEVEGVLGEGGTGVVYSARDRTSGGDVALKVMHPHLATEEQVRGRFSREAAILRRLEGPHVCRILESGEVDNPGGGEPLLCLALPRIPGRSLDHIVAEGRLPEARATKLLREILEALESAHGHDVIHRDLKPHNVIVDDEGHATVVDFGLSKILNGGGTGTTNLTALNMVFGTPEYMSPEQARGDDLDNRCDLYACGVMLFEMLTGELPFRGRTPLAVLTAHLTDDPPLPESRVPAGTISPAVSAIVLRALSKIPDNRYPSAGAMRSALERAEVFPDEPDDVPERRAVVAKEPEPEPEPEPEAAPPTKRTAELPLAPKAKSDPKIGETGKSATFEAGKSTTAHELVHGATELSLTPKPPSSRRLAEPPRSESGSRPRSSSKPPTSKREVPKRDHRWTFAWILVIAASVVVGVVLGLR